MKGVAVRGVRVKLSRENKAKWFDMNLRREVRGKQLQYRVLHSKSGTWLFNVYVARSIGKITVGPPDSEGTSSAHDQIKRKTIVFNRCRKPKGYYYHPLGISYLQTGRLHYERVADIKNVPSEIAGHFTLRLYEDVAPRMTGPYIGKIVAIVKASETSKMVLLFVLEKILPLFP